MALDFNTALNQYGFVGAMAQSNPELAPLFQQAVNEEWDAARFQRELTNTAWYKRLSENQRAIKLQEATDPATWAQTLNTKADSVLITSRSMGFTNVDTKLTARLALENGWDDAQVRHFIGLTYGLAKAGSGYTAQAGEAEAHLRQSYANYGLPVSAKTLEARLRQVLSGENTLGGIDNEIRNAAKSQYPAFAAELDSGRNLRDIADPYIQQMGATLEMNVETLDLNDPYVKKALQGQDGKPMTLWQFERSLKDDARWQKTNNAKNQTYSILQQVGQDWGFSA